jgi:hypothetical protein
MKLVKSLLLSGAAGLVAVSGASAADLAVTKPAPAEYVRVCSAEGAGFFYIPGSETCLKIGGRVRFDVAFTDSATYDPVTGEPVDPTTTGADVDWGYDFKTSAVVSFDARTATSLGTLRSFIELNLGEDDGANPGNSTTMGDAFISLGGFTVGRTQTLFGFDDPLYAGAGSVDQIQYLATFGSGFYAGVGIEDADEVKGGTFGNGLFGLAGVGGFSQEFQGVLAVGYNNGGTHVRLAGLANTDDLFAVQLQAQQAFGAATIFGAVWYANDDDATGASIDAWSANLKLSYTFNEQFSANIGAGYRDFDGFGGLNREQWRVTAGFDYTVVPGFVVGPEVTYEDTDEDTGTDFDTFSGRIRFQRNF